jgi:hypothetical protein
MAGEMPRNGEGRARDSRIARWIGGLGILFLALFGAYKFFTLPTTARLSETVSPDGGVIVTVDDELYGIFDRFRAVSIAPNYPVLNWLLREKIIEIHAEHSDPEPEIHWDGGKLVMITLPVAQEKLAATLRNGLYPDPAADHYHSVRIVYRAH